MVLTAFAVGIALCALGGHVLIPWSLGEKDRDGGGRDLSRRRKVWGLVGPLLISSALVLWLLWIRAHPEAPVEAGWGGGGHRLAQLVGQGLIILLTALLAMDLVGALAGARLERLGWRLLGAFGVLPLGVATIALELLRIGAASGAGALNPFLVAVLCRVVIALAAGEALLDRRPTLAPWAGVLLPVYGLALPPALAQTLLAEGAGFTLAAATLLLLACRFLPSRLRRPAQWAGLMLTALLLAWALERSPTLVLDLDPMPPLPGLPGR